MKHTHLWPKFYEAIAQGAMFGIVIFDGDSGECLFINQMAIEMLGTETPHAQELVPQQDRPQLRSFSMDLLDSDGLFHDVLINNVYKQPFIGNVGVRQLDVEGVKARLLMLQDVTLQKKLQRDIMAKQTEIKAAFEELRKQNRQLRELDVAKNRFIALTTHELRTPLAAMIASAEILKIGLYDSPEEMKQFIEIIYDQGQHLSDLVNDILDLAKIQAGKMDFFIEQANPAPVVQNLMRNFESMAAGNSVTLQFEDPGPALLCFYDELRLKQIVSNMVNNAIKYNKPNGSVRVYFEQDDKIVRILVEDTGKGIAPDQIEKVFNEFETIGHVNAHHKGTGLGMPISRRLAEGMGGAVNLRSQEGVGSTFWVEIPKEKVLDPSLYRPRPEISGDLAAS